MEETKKKRVITPEHRAKLSAGAKAAAEKRKAEKALATQANQYQTDTLENAKKDKENQRILKEEFARIKKRITENQNPPKKLNKRLDLDEEHEMSNLEQHQEPEPTKKTEPVKIKEEPKIPIVDKLIDASKNNDKVLSDWDENELVRKKTKFDETVKQICSSMPNQKTRDIFTKAVGQYDVSLTLNQNIQNLISECNNQIQLNARYIKEKDDEQKKVEYDRKIKEEETRKKQEADDLEQKKKLEHDKRLKEFYRLLNKK
jgi:hypothetical protein